MCPTAVLRPLAMMVVHSTKPIIMSHTGAKGVWNTKRLASDELIQAIAAKGGVVGIEVAHTPPCQRPV